MATTSTDRPRDLATARDLAATWRKHGTVADEVLDWFDWALGEVQAWQDAVAALGDGAFGVAHAATELAVLLQGLGAERLRVEGVR